MAYIGNEPTSAAFVTDLFSGNGVTTTFTMSVAPANTASVLIAISGVVQSPDTYSINATTLTFSPAPPAGTGNISVRYLGIPATNVTTTAYRTVTEFTATASQTTFSVPSYTVGYIDVYRNGVRLGTADYTATSGTSVVLANAATAGDLVATESFYVSSVLNAIPATGGSINTIYLDAGNANGTGALLTPSGTTAQRPASPIVGMQRWNTTIGGMEVYIGTGSTGWQTIASTAYSVDYLVVAGGGGGGGAIYMTTQAGGGGAGGLIAASGVSVSPGTSYTITIGAGGAGGVANGIGTSGTNSGFGSIATAIGGGYGGTYSNGGPAAGGSGGGGSTGTVATGAAGTAGQGFAGGTATAYASNSAASGAGGGGSASVGANGSGGTGGSGGSATTSTISGSSITYAGGGGGGGYSVGGTATGGGGAGAAINASGTGGSVNTGGGGGGGSGGNVDGQNRNGGAGGSGIVIIRYLGTVQRATGGTVTITGGYVIHTFTSSSTYTA
jgi:hypothetical protein